MTKNFKTASFGLAALRLAPIVLSVTTLAFVAACARTNGGKTSLSTETQEQAVTTVMKQSGISDYEWYNPKNMALSARIVGSQLEVANRANGSLDARLSVSIKDGSDILATGKIAAAGVLHLIDSNVKPEDKTRLDVTSQCADAACTRMAVLLTEMEAIADVPAVPAVVAAPVFLPTGAKVVIVFHLKKDKVVDSPADLQADDLQTPAPVADAPVSAAAYVIAWTTPVADGQFTSGTQLNYQDGSNVKAGKPVAVVVTPAAIPVPAPSKTDVASALPTEAQVQASTPLAKTDPAAAMASLADVPTIASTPSTAPVEVKITPAVKAPAAAVKVTKVTATKPVVKSKP